MANDVVTELLLLEHYVYVDTGEGHGCTVLEVGSSELQTHIGRQRREQKESFTHEEVYGSSIFEFATMTVFKC